MKIRTTFLAIACLVAAATPALAAEKPEFRVGAQGGWDRAKSGGSTDGILYGVTLGVDLPVGSGAFVGIEAAADASTAKECVSNLVFVGDRACLKVGRDLSAVARLGGKVSDRVKIYALGGYTNGQLKATYSVGGSKSSASDTGDGYRIGAGTEFALTKSVYSKLEYRYSNYKGDLSRHQILGGIGLVF